MAGSVWPSGTLPLAGDPKTMSGLDVPLVILGGTLLVLGLTSSLIN